MLSDAELALTGQAGRGPAQNGRQAHAGAAGGAPVKMLGNLLDREGGSLRRTTPLKSSSRDIRLRDNFNVAAN